MPPAVTRERLPCTSLTGIEIGKMGRIALLCFVLAAAYAIARYHVFGGVPWSRLPLFTLNKAVALSAAALLARGPAAARIAFWLATCTSS